MNLLYNINQRLNVMTIKAEQQQKIGANHEDEEHNSYEAMIMHSFSYESMLYNKNQTVIQLSYFCTWLYTVQLFVCVHNFFSFCSILFSIFIGFPFLFLIIGICPIHIKGIR